MNLSYSYSKLNDYAMCPFYFKSRHVDRIPVAVNDELNTGRIIHEILCAYAKECYKQGKPQIVSIQDSGAGFVPEFVDEIVDEVLRKYPITPELEDEIRKNVEEYVCANEIELDGLAGVEEEIAIDEYFNAVKWNAENVWFRAKLDRLYMRGDQAEVRDYKTGYTMQPDKFQLEIYAWLVYKLYPHINFMQVEFDFKRLAYKTIIPIGKEALKSIQRKIKNRIKQVAEDTTFTPQLNANCGRCPYWNICPAIKEFGDNNTPLKCPNNKTEAGEILERVVALEKLADEAKKNPFGILR